MECGATHRWVVDKYSLEDDNSEGPALAAICAKCSVVSEGTDGVLRAKCADALERYPEFKVVQRTSGDGPCERAGADTR